MISKPDVCMAEEFTIVVGRYPSSARRRQRREAVSRSQRPRRRVNPKPKPPRAAAPLSVEREGNAVLGRGAVVVARPTRNPEMQPALQRDSLALRRGVGKAQGSEQGVRHVRESARR